MAELVLSELNIYPIKSTAGFSVPSAEVQARGLKGDRRWMVVDQNHKFMTQRKLAKMALIQVQPEPDCLKLAAPGMASIAVPVPAADQARIRVEVWGDICDAITADETASRWFSEFLDVSCQLVYMPDDSIRLVNPTYAVQPDRDHVSFADSFPVLLTSEASLQDLNRRLEEPIPMNRFRPNFVISGCDAFAEDTWQKIRIGSLIFHVVKGCDRCIVPSIDQTTGIKTKEPLPTLATYRLREGKIYFGQNLLPETLGMVSVGDRVEVLELK
jgi:uncharacterized protein